VNLTNNTPRCKGSHQTTRQKKPCEVPLNRLIDSFNKLTIITLNGTGLGSLHTFLAESLIRIYSFKQKNRLLSGRFSLASQTNTSQAAIILLAHLASRQDDRKYDETAKQFLQNAPELNGHNPLPKQKDLRDCSIASICSQQCET
jgi:hypothetical protein